MKTKFAVLFTIFTLYFGSVFSAQARSEFPIDLDPVASSNAMEWGIQNFQSWANLLVGNNIISSTQVSSWSWEKLYYYGSNQLFTVHTFLEDTQLFSLTEIMDSFGIDKFYANEWPRTPRKWQEMFTRELSLVEIGTVCARLTTILAQKKEMPPVIQTDKQFLYRRESVVAQIHFSSVQLNGFGDADLIISVSSELITDGETYGVYHESETQEVIAKGNKLTFHLITSRLGWGFTIFRADGNSLQSTGIVSGNFPAEILIEGAVEYFGAKKIVSETAVIPQSILPLLEISKIGEYFFKYKAEQKFSISDGGFAATFPSSTEHPSEIVVSININGSATNFTLTNEWGDDWYAFPYQMSIGLIIGQGEGEFVISFPNGETPDITWLGLYPNETADYVFIDKFNPPYCGGSSGGGGGSSSVNK